MSKKQKGRLATAKRRLEQIEELLRPYEADREPAPPLLEERWEAAQHNTVRETSKELAADTA